MVGQSADRPAVPLHDLRDELGDDDEGSGWKDVEGGAKREAHSEAADEDAGPGKGTARRQPSTASASSEPCIRLDIRLWPLAIMTCSVAWQVSVSSVPSGVRARPMTSQGFTAYDSEIRRRR